MGWLRATIGCRRDIAGSLDGRQRPRWLIHSSIRWRTMGDHGRA
jgi:hypothetical protein